MASFLKLLLFFLVHQLSGATPQTVVHTEYGSIRGFLDNQARVFRSIPYAAPPLDDLRWVNPQPPSSWREIKDCTAEVVGCPQSCNRNPPLTTTECPLVQSEDCLYLNVWTPLTATESSSFPVLIYIHGGSFRSGYSGGLLYNGSRMVNTTEAIVVTINYRLGALGSLWDPTLGLEGNYGYMDQVFAIEWTYRNIQTFGGNPERIILFGESAGAHSVYLHLMNTSSPIKGGIAQSPPLGLPLRSPEAWGTLPLTFSEEAGCDPNRLSSKRRLECLRRVDASEVVNAQYVANNKDPQRGWEVIKDGMDWTPTVGNGSVIPEQPLFAFQNGHYNQEIPFMAGTNSGEGFMFTLPYVDYEVIDLLLVTGFGPEIALKVKAFYNISSENGDENMYETMGRVITDSWFRCPTRNTMISSANSQWENIGYFYHFNYIASYVEHVWYYKPECWEFVCHTEELPMVWNADSSSIYVFPTIQERLASNQLQFMWTNFAETGNPARGPHADKLWTKWIDYGSDAMDLQRTLMIDGVTPSEIQMVIAPDDEVCNFWDSLGYKWFDARRI